MSPKLRSSILPILAFAAVLIAGVGAWFGMSRSQDLPEIGGTFTLVNGDGQTVTDRDFRGQSLLVYFGYTYCPDVCPTTLGNLAAAVDLLGVRAGSLRILFVSVDPDRDTPGVVKQYVASFGPYVIGLTGTPQQVAATARAYRVFYAKHRTGAGPNDYTMDHTSFVYLVDRNGKFLSPLRAELPPEKLAAEIGSHLKS